MFPSEVEMIGQIAVRSLAGKASQYSLPHAQLEGNLSKAGQINMFFPVLIWESMTFDFHTVNRCLYENN